MRPTHVVRPGDSPQTLSVLGEAVQIFGRGDLSKPFEVHLQKGVKGGGPPPHHHPWDEAFYVLEGEVAVTVDGEREVLGAGGFVHIPADTVHAYENVSENATLLAIVSDPRGGDLFAALDEHVKVLPDDLPKVIEVSRGFDVHFLVDEPA